MLPGYKRGYLNAQAFKRLDAGIDVPAAQLSMGFHSVMNGIPVRYTAPVQKRPVMRPVQAIEDTGMLGQGNPVTPAAFPNSGYFGEALGGVDY